MPPDVQGIELYGVGKWREISNHLPDWNDNELRSRTAKLLGSQSLAPYIGWRGRKYAFHPSVQAHSMRALGHECYCSSLKEGLDVMAALGCACGQAGNPVSS